jgi:hypothetical protein
MLHPPDYQNYKNQESLIRGGVFKNPNLARLYQTCINMVSLGVFTFSKLEQHEIELNINNFR